MDIIIGIVALAVGLLIGLLAGLARANGPRFELAGIKARLDEVQATAMARSLDMTLWVSMTVPISRTAASPARGSLGALGFRQTSFGGGF